MENNTHIRQIGVEYTYTVVIENGEQALIDHPELFERVEGEVPEGAQFLIYTPN
jgi:hypothetical protein